LCHLRTYKTCPHTGTTLSESDLLPIITGQSNTLLTQSRSIAEMIEQLGNEYDSLVLEGFVSKEELQKVREELAVSLYQQDAALRVIAKLKS
jgi:pre-mRNA-processing factor 19